MSAHRILVLGGGSIGTRHARNLLARRAGDVMVIDPDSSRRETLEKELSVRTGTDADAALAAFRPDIVFICSPTRLHVPQALKAVEAGAHVFMEKPLSHALEGVDLLKKRAEEKKRTVMIGCNMRFHPGVAQMKRLLDEGAIGKPKAARIVYRGYLPTWRPQQDYRKSYSASVEQGGAVLDCIHEIDLALWEFGPGDVTASRVTSAASIGLATDGLAEFTIKHGNGAESRLHLSFIEEQFERSQHITGSEGTLDWDFTRGTVQRSNRDGALAEEIRQPDGWDFNRMFEEELDHFLNAVETGTIPMGSLEEATSALTIALKVRSSP